MNIKTILDRGISIKEINRGLYWRSYDDQFEFDTFLQTYQK